MTEAQKRANDKWRKSEHGRNHLQEYEATTERRKAAALTQKKIRINRKAAGLCMFCGQKPPRENRSYCSECRQYQIKSTTKIRTDRAANGTCSRCGKNPAIIGLRTDQRFRPCEICWFKQVSRANVGSESQWETIRMLFYRTGGLCVYTGTQLHPGVNASLDHIIPTSKGGSNDTENLQWVMTEINFMKRHHTEAEFLRLISLVAKHINL